MTISSPNLGSTINKYIYTINMNPEESVIWYTYKKYTNNKYNPYTIDRVLDYRINMNNGLNDPKSEYTEDFYIREISGCDLLLKLIYENKAY